jgi:hypothetical protein
LQVIENNEALAEKLKGMICQLKVFCFKNGKGNELNAWIIKPKI